MRADLLPSDACPPDQSSPYQFDQRANDLLHIVFPKVVQPAGYARAYVDRARPMKFSSRDEVLAYHSTSINVGDVACAPFDTAGEATESIWRTARPSNGRVKEFFEQAGAIELLAKSLADAKSVPGNLLEKSLWQRDLICTLQAVLHCQSLEQDKSRKSRWDAAKNCLVECLKRAVFTVPEYQKLRAEIALAAGKTHFITQCRCLLADDYLPPVVFGPAPDWYELPSDEAPGLHFQAYGGRSFIRILIKTPGMTESEFFDYWAKVTKQFGMSVTISATVPHLPAPNQTILLRTFGIFLDDGSYVDSRIPEEVLVRINKYSDATLDSGTSDGLGTLHYQYKLRRSQVLKDPASFGLCRVRDTDSQFYGFFADYPDPHASEHITTMRANCISCHSEVLYGASTIFSLCRHAPARTNVSKIQGGQMQPMGPNGWLIKQESLHTIQSELMNRLKKAS
jgi:hypothetical protein